MAEKLNYKIVKTDSGYECQIFLGKELYATGQGETEAAARANAAANFSARQDRESRERTARWK